ncbi:hypothetical protein [Pseudomonas sp. B329]|uniref:hypothetical protein n=1 Tax=Pseudomonas sp. B329 TaxID=1553459 RepID=UPI0020048756|nr:hypothetical protein [Pseudomonas sp. B329]MCK3863929.1 hypothetical protein [Pseudomonas sp. B329]
MTPENSTGPVPVKPELPAEVANGVTPAYLQANGDTLLVTVPVYPTQVVGSKIGMRIGGPDEELIVPYVITSTTTAAIVPITGDVLRTFPDGVHLIYYTITNTSGQVSPNSKGAFLRLALKTTT